jgi:metal transporter CNNM
MLGDDSTVGASTSKSLSEYLIFSGLSLICVLFGGLMSGLTVGLLGIDELELELKVSSGTPEEKNSSKKILAIISHHHLLLVTLLLANSLAMETLPLLLGEIFTPAITVVLSVTFVLAFGEVIPQALCTGTNQINIACKAIPIVKCLIVLFFPLSYPIAKLLDYILDHEESSVKLKSNDLKTFISLHEGFCEEKPLEIEGLDKLQIKMMHEVIDINKFRIKDFMLPYSDFVCLSIDTPVTKEVVEKVAKGKYHTIPVYRASKRNINGVIPAQELFKICEGDIIENSDIIMADPIKINHKTTLLSALQEMEAYDSTISFVMQDFHGKLKVAGVITKELILKKLTQGENLTERKKIESISHALLESVPSRNRIKTTGSLRETLI